MNNLNIKVKSYYWGQVGHLPDDVTTYTSAPNL